MKIYGNGIDITEVERIEALCESFSFEERFFTKNESDYANKSKNKSEHFAGFFSAKEAFSKAVGSGIRGFKLNEVEVCHDELGKPFFCFYGSALELVSQNSLCFSLSISHTSNYAVANVIAWRED